MNFAFCNLSLALLAFSVGCGRQSGAEAAPSTEAAATPKTGMVKPAANSESLPASDAPPKVSGTNPLTPEIERDRALLQEQLSMRPGQAEVGLIRNLRRKLAAAGDEQELNRIAKDLAATNLADQAGALEDARVVGGRMLVTALVAVLDDRRPGGRILSDVGVPPPRKAAAAILAELLTNAPLKRKEARFQSDAEIETFKQWWKTNGAQ